MTASWVKDHPLPGFDPASAWSIGYGKDFVPSHKERKTDKDDFSFAVATVGTNLSCTFLVDATPLGKPGAAAKVLKEFGANRLSRLPLRRRCLMNPVIGKPLPDISKSKRPGGYTKAPPKALVGVIDHAINVAHERFTRSDGSSRVAFAWFQGAKAKPGVPFGREWSGKDLSTLIKSCGSDDETLLRAMGEQDFSDFGENPLSFRQSHGTHVLDMAAGADPDDASAQKSDILAVMLPPVVARESSGEILPFFFLRGLAYLLQRARELNSAWKANVPLYVNASLGISGGPRNGQGPIEEGIKALLADHRALGGSPVTVVLPAGNRNLAEGHAASGQTLSVPWRLQPGDRTSNHIEAHIAGMGDVSLELTLPGGQSTNVTLPVGQAQRLMLSGEVIGRAVLEAVSKNQMRLGLSLSVTDPADLARVPAPSGRWHLKITAPNRGSQIEAWILRDDSPPGFSDGGRQSYFHDPEYVRYKKRGDVRTDDPDPPSTVRRAGALNGMATSKEQVVVGGYSLLESGGESGLRPALYSAGPLKKDRKLTGGENVTVSAVSDRSRHTGGVIGAGTLSGSAVVMNGTSVAAPQAVRLLAESGTHPKDAAKFLIGKVGPKPGEPYEARGGAGGLPYTPRLPHE